jgi:hypothetical protein
MNRHPRAAVALVGVAAALAACSGNSTAPSATSSSAAASASSPAPSATSDNCAKAQLADAAAGAARVLGKDNVYTIDNLKCVDGWAVTSGVLASTQNPTMGAPTSFVFRRVGEVWVGQDKTKVCGTNPTTTTAPADATIPAALFLAGCAAG